MRRLIRALEEIQSDDALLVGGKAFNCARLKQAGIPVPDGLVLTTELMGTSLEVPELRDWLKKLPSGVLLAVRSSAPGEDSAEHSFAGIYETRLNVQPEDVPAAVRTCWSSVSSAAALAYRRARHVVNGDSRTAVLVQRMIQPVASGVAFTVNPISGNEREMLINSAFGLGEAVVSGRVEPDEFAIRKVDGEIVSKRITGPSASLTDEQLRALAALLLRIDTLFGAAQDVEWCYDGVQFWIVQSRPVTAAPVTSRKDIQWTRANAREVLPELASPMTIYAVADVIEQVERQFYGKLLAPEAELGRMARVFYGRMYFNVDQVRYTSRLAGVAPAAILRSLGHEGEIDPADEVVQRPSIGEFVRTLPDLIRLAIGQITVQTRVRQQLIRTERAIEEWRSLDYSTLSDKELWAKSVKWRPRFGQELKVVFTLAAVSTYERLVRQICDKVGMPYERLLHTHLAAGEKSVSSQQAFDLLRLVKTARKEQRGLSSAAFQTEFEQFLQKYGHRGHYESDIAMPRFVEDPSPLLFAIRSHLQSSHQPDPAEIMKRQDEEAVKSWNEFQSRLSLWQRMTIAPKTRWLLRRIKQFYVWREIIRSEMVRVALPIRRLHLEMARRFIEHGWIASADNYFYLTLEDVDAVVDDPGSGPSLQSIIAHRKSEWQQLSQIVMPSLIRESQLAALARNVTGAVSADGTGSELRGLCVSAGYVEAEVVVMRDPGEFSRMKPGAILVAPATDPSWTPIFTLASGVIVEVGGVLSHASTVAREFGLPALANVRHATTILKDGDRVRLDATNGVIRLSPASDERCK